MRHFTSGQLARCELDAVKCTASEVPTSTQNKRALTEKKILGIGSGADQTHSVMRRSERQGQTWSELGDKIGLSDFDRTQGQAQISYGYT